MVPTGGRQYWLYRAINLYLSSLFAVVSSLCLNLLGYYEGFSVAELMVNSGWDGSVGGNGGGLGGGRRVADVIIFRGTCGFYQDL